MLNDFVSTSDASDSYIYCDVLITTNWSSAFDTRKDIKSVGVSKIYTQENVQLIHRVKENKIGARFANQFHIKCVAILYENGSAKTANTDLLCFPRRGDFIGEGEFCRKWVLWWWGRL